MTQAPEKRYRLMDGKQEVVFEGDQLASVSSQVDGPNPSPRWTELAIYKTVTGRYVVEKIGRSDVFHKSTCGKPGKSAAVYDSILDALAEIDPKADEQDLPNFFVPCPDCRPSFSSDEPVVVEQDMHSVDAYGSPEMLIEALYQRKNGTVRSLSNLSRTVLDQAARKDPAIAAIRSKPVNIS